MAINTIQGFNPSTTEPIDSRVTVANETARLAFATFNVYEGLVVYQQDTDELYVLTNASDPSDNNNWSEVGEGAGFPFTGSAGILGSLNINGITTLNTGSFNISIGHPNYPSFPSLDLGNTTENFGNVGLGAGTLFDLLKGSNNFAIGFGSQFNLTSGSGNVAIGASSFFQPTIGFNNVAIGSKALYQFTGSDNVAIGNQALYGANGTTGEGESANKGSFNVAVGSLAHNSSNDSYNVAIGYKSFQYHVTGSNNVAIGSQTARITVSGGPDNFTHGNNSVYIGASIKPYVNDAENETLIGSGTEGIGENSVVIGNSSVTTTILKGNVGIGINNPTKKLEVANSDILVNDMTIGLGNGQISTNVVLGKGAFTSNTIGKDTIAIGENALASTSDKDGNIAIGQEALFNTVNNNNTGIGYRTLYSNISGSRNTAIGRQALEDNTKGDRNTGIGQRAAEGNSVGNDNTAIGDRALVHNRSGSFNIAIGTDAARGLDQNTDFSNVTAIGAFSLNSLASGSANTAIGVSSSLSLHSGSNNISIGNISANAFESGSNNVFIGGYDGSSHTTSNNNIFFSDGEGNIRLFITGSNGNTGIGTVLPSEKLTVEGNISASGEIIGSSFNITNITGSNISASGNIIGDTGSFNRVNIGTTTPAQILNVNSGTADAVAKFASTDTKAFIILEDNGDQGYIGVQTNRLVLGTNTDFTSTDNVYIKNDGNVGIGNSSPSSKLTVSGDIGSTGNITTSTGNITTSTGYISSATNITASGGNISLGELGAANIVGAGEITITPGRNLNLQHFENYSVQIQSTEGVNIIDATQGQVTITGNITASANISASGTGSFDSLSVIGNVGIGTTSPTRLLTVGTSSANNTFIEKINPSGSIFIGSSDLTRFGFAAGKVNLGFSTGGPNNDVPLAIGTFSTAQDLIFGTDNTERMRISGSNGYVGIGTTSPTEKLTVEGNISSSGDIIGDTGSFNTISVIGEYTLPSSDGSANQVIKTNGSGILSFTTPTPVPTIYTPDVYEINSVIGITSTNTLLTFRGSGDPTIIDGTTGTIRTDSVDDSITFNSEGIFEISYSVQMQQGASSATDVRMNPQVYAKFGTSGATSAAAGSSNITYIRLINSGTNNQAPNGACTCTFYVEVTDAEHILELLVAFTQPATNIDLDIVQFELVPNTLSIRKIS